MLWMSVANGGTALCNVGVKTINIETAVPAALEGCDYALILRRGEIVAEGQPEELRDTERFFAALMG
jgi:ABC-type branched-subunit amino acid transport system ATPase component